MPSFDGLRWKLYPAGLEIALPCVLFIACSEPAHAAIPPVALTQNGIVYGTSANGENLFRGLRYAQPPTGALRWRPPEPLRPGFGLIDGTMFGAHCPQPASYVGIASATEDCLFLNVYTPARELAFASQKMPVMVWVHGGGFLEGESDDYDPVRLVTQGNVIVVTVNYRLGALGIFAHPALDHEGHKSANYAIMDQQAALLWVRRNIAGFGGDPGNVTLFGQSSGGQSVFASITSPGAHGLFHAAIIESGAEGNDAQPSLATAEADGEAVAKAVGCANQTAACLRGVSVAQLLAVSPTGGPAGLLTTNTIVDGKVLPLPIPAALTIGAFNRVPVMDGSNHDEGRFLTALQFDLAAGPLLASDLTATVAGSYGEATTPAILAEYPLGNYGGVAPNAADLAFAAILGDSILSCSARAADMSLSRYVKTYAYEFDDGQAPEKTLPPVSFPYGATHSIELQFLFGPLSVTGAEADLADTMVQYWTHFAQAHVPAASSQPLWRPYKVSTDQFQALTPGAIGSEGDFAVAHHCSFWNPSSDGSG